MASEITFLLSGIVFGLSSGLVPGPITILGITATLQHNVKEGIKVSIAPILTDLPIVLITVFILSRLSDMLPVLGTISLFGSAFLAYLGYESFSFKGVDIDNGDKKPHSIRRGGIANLLSPFPYMFWFSVGAPTVIKAMDVSVTSVILFLVCFYGIMVGSKIVIVFLIGRSRRLLKSNSYIYTIRALGFVLWVFAAFFIKNGLQYFGII